MKLLNARKMVSAKAEQAIVQQLPIDQKTLRRVGRLAEPKNLKRIVVLVVGGSVLFSLIGTLSKIRMYRAAVRRELKKQLEPINRKLDELEAQNEELKRQNKELQKKL
jgi:hypothetical protein